MTGLGRTIGRVNERALREFLSRDWPAATNAKAEHWVRVYRENPEAVWDAAQALLAHARAVRPEFPNTEQREADFQAHLTLRLRLDRAAHAFSGR
jgi:hypothetical protein